MQKIITQVVEYLEHLEVLDTTNKKSVKDKSTNKYKTKSKGHKSKKRSKKTFKKRKRSKDSDTYSDGETNSSRPENFCHSYKAECGHVDHTELTIYGWDRAKFIKKLSSQRAEGNPSNFMNKN